MHIYDYSFLKSGMLPADLISSISAISAFNALSGARRDQYDSVYSELESIARVLSVKGSNAIEGIVTSDARIKAIVDRNSEPLTHDEEEIAGYRDALDLIHTQHKNLTVSEDLLRELHRLIYSRTSGFRGGQYKSENNHIIAIDSSGHRSVRFQPVSAEETQKNMEQLMLAYYAARDTAGLDKLLLIPCVVLDFLCIHPFADGNGRVSRLLTLLLLYKAGFDVAKFVSFEEQINRHKDLYYDALYVSSAGWHDNSNSYFRFMENFLFTVYGCYRELDSRFSSVNGKKIPKSKRIEETVLNSILPVSKADICNALPEVSPSTVESVLWKLVREGSVKKLGQARSTKYVNAKFVE